MIDEINENVSRKVKSVLEDILHPKNKIQNDNDKNNKLKKT